ncbi:hypothetical protein DITRI_Ditri05aG0164700 [Diplodiscus trichospermus]
MSKGNRYTGSSRGKVRLLACIKLANWLATSIVVNAMELAYGLNLYTKHEGQKLYEEGQYGELKDRLMTSGRLTVDDRFIDIEVNGN